MNIPKDYIDSYMDHLDELKIWPALQILIDSGHICLHYIEQSLWEQCYAGYVLGVPSIKNAELTHRSLMNTIIIFSSKDVKH